MRFWRLVEIASRLSRVAERMEQAAYLRGVRGSIRPVREATFGPFEGGNGVRPAGRWRGAVVVRFRGAARATRRAGRSSADRRTQAGGRAFLVRFRDSCVGSYFFLGARHEGVLNVVGGEDAANGISDAMFSPSVRVCVDARIAVLSSHTDDVDDRFRCAVVTETRERGATGRVPVRRKKIHPVRRVKIDLWV